MIRHRLKSGFTLIELLAVIAIIGILGAIIIASVSGVRASARTVTCRSNLRQLGVAGLLYAQDNRGKLFPYRGNDQDKGYNWLLRPYIGGESAPEGSTAALPLLLCPSSQLAVADRIKYPRFTYAVNKTLAAQNAAAPEPRLDAVHDRHHVLFFGDSGQVPEWSGSSSHGFIWNARPIPPDPTAILSPTTDPDADDASGGGYFRYRHNGLCQAVFLDGSVRAFRPGELRNRNYYWPY